MDKSNANLGSHGSRRKNTSKACEECRRRRAKCDGRQPTCSRCVARSMDCRYAMEPDGRRPASKSYVDLLRNRISLLERVLQSHSISIDSSIAQLVVTDRQHVTNFEDLEVSSPSDLAAHSDFPATEEISTVFKGALSLEEPLNFDQDGEVRYFGPSSGRLEFRSGDVYGTGKQQTPMGNPPQHARRPGRQRPQSNLFLESLEEESEPTEELKSHLIDLYFGWEQPWSWVVNEKLFRESQLSGGKYCSKLLLNCIFAIGARFSDRLELRSNTEDANTAGLLFLENAEVLLHFDLKWPSITSIQSLFIMGSMYLAIGADAAGWLHHGMANRLALDMGLNLDAASLEGSGFLPIEEIELRRQIYWTLYCHDKLSASYTGRVCTMLDSQGTVELPIISQTKDSQSPVENSHIKLRRSTITLCQVLERILSNLYAPKPSIPLNKRISFLEDTLLGLKTWFYDLPSELRIDHVTSSTTLPQVFTLHMVYHTSLILLIKPYVAVYHRPKRTPLTPIIQEKEDAIIKNASIRCYNSAREICVVARKYRQLFGSFRRSPLSATHCTLSAALVLLQAMKASSTRARNVSDHNFERCLQVLDELSISWTPPKKIRDSLIKMYEPWKQLKLAPENSSEAQKLSTLSDPSSRSSSTHDHRLLTETPRSIGDDFWSAEMLSASSDYDFVDSTQNVLLVHDPGDIEVNYGDNLSNLEDTLVANVGLDSMFNNLPGDYGSFDWLNRTQFSQM